MYSFVTRETIYTIIDKIDNYTIIHRDTEFQPWIVACGFDKTDNTWAQGYYYDTLANAVAYARDTRVIDIIKNIDDYTAVCIKDVDGKEIIREDLSDYYNYKVSQIWTTDDTLMIEVY